MGGDGRHRAGGLKQGQGISVRKAKAGRLSAGRQLEYARVFYGWGSLCALERLGGRQKTDEKGQ